MGSSGGDVWGAMGGAPNARTPLSARLAQEGMDRSPSRNPATNLAGAFAMHGGDQDRVCCHPVMPLERNACTWSSEGCFGLCSFAWHVSSTISASGAGRPCLLSQNSCDCMFSAVGRKAARKGRDKATHLCLIDGGQHCHGIECARGLQQACSLPSRVVRPQVVLPRELWTCRCHGAARFGQRKNC